VSDGLVSLISVLAIAIIVVRRRTVAIGLLAAQSLVLGIGALSLSGDRSSEYLTAALVLLTKAVVVPLLLYWLIRRTPEPRLVVAPNGPLVRLSVAVALAICAGVLMPSLGLGSGEIHTERAAVALVLVGIAIVVMRRPTLFQLLGLIVAENGVALLAVSVPGGLSYVVELGALFDLAVVVAVAAAFAQRIHAEFGSGDTELLRGLRD
jgi:hydrogenase-4 component E